MKKIFTLLFGLSTLFGQAQNCLPSTAKTDLDINNIRATLLNGGDMWWDGVSEPAYQYPKVDTSLGELPKNLIFAGALWMTALDESGNLKCAAQTYRNQGHEFWPGPLVYGQAGISDVTCTNFDRFFPILRTELNNHISAVASSNNSLSISAIAPNILQWPGKGNQYLADTYNMNIVNDLAPFQDCNNNGIYDPQNGDYPLMKGDQSIFWVMNDLGNAHVRSGGDPLSVEIQCMAYAYVTNDAVNDATFYDYKILKKTQGNLHDFYFSQYVDPDLGVWSNDYIGCDTVLNYAFCYDANNSDFNGAPPTIITQFLKTPLNKGLSSFNHFSTERSNPANDVEFRNIQKGNWNDGSSITCGGNGNGGTISTKFVYPGNPAVNTNYNNNCSDWSECSAGTTPSDRRFVMSSGPYDLTTDQPLEFTIALIVATTTPATFSGCPDKITLINPVVSFVDDFIANVNENPYQCKVLSGILDFEDEKNLVNIYPNPANDFIMIKTSEDFKINTIEIYDAIGKLVSSKNQEKIIDVSAFSKGVYTMKIFSQETNKVLLKKFVLR